MRIVKKLLIIIATIAFIFIIGKVGNDDMNTEIKDAIITQKIINNGR